DIVIDCRGPAAGDLLGPLGLSVGRQTSPGLLVISEPLPSCFDLVVHTPGVNLRPDGGGRVRLAADDLDDRLETEVAAGSPLTVDSRICREFTQEIVRRGCAVLPALRGTQIEAVRLGWRALPGDNLSAVGPVPDVPGYYLAFTHSGVTLGPLLGRLITQELTTGRVPPELADFRPDRLLSSVPTLRE
ncbi:MAG TPA: FAD-binding oxidoreductase, partial [Dehalococcoidia bacterium]|nr:FAD-binding oxidoreductase [Dehalococcoidia bacterium]